MRAMCSALSFSILLVCTSVMSADFAHSRPLADIQYEGKTPEGLAGNGRAVVKVRPDGFEFFSGGNAKGRFRLVVDGVSHELHFPGARSTFFPGGVLYETSVDGVSLEIIHGATPNVPYIVAVRVRGCKKSAELDVESSGQPPIHPHGRIPFKLKSGDGHIVLSAGAADVVLPGTWDGLRDAFEAPYRNDMILETPRKDIDRAVPFCRFLLDLGFDGRLHVSELFRWRDIWSRDLGSGLAPGAMISGRFSAARTSIEYDLRRYAAAHPRGLRITEDASQGGSAEGTAWLTRAVWRDYLLTGDTAFLRNAADTLRPWVDAWIDRDADEDGLLVDVTEWMDHSRFLLFPDGSRVLYSNALVVDLLKNFSRIELSLGNDESSRRLDAVRRRFIGGINAGLWNESAGVYDNLTLWGRRDERLSSAENALAVLAGVAPADRAKRLMGAIRARNWRAAGSVTITPAMTHVDDRNDQNVRVWPWWNAVEARARFRMGDIDGGVHLLDRCAATLQDEHYPGLIEELLTPDGVTEGGHAFLSAAGSFLDAVFEGLLGIEILEPGCAKIRVAPNIPASWKKWNATVPLPQGEIVLSGEDGRIRIRVTDPRVKTIEAPANAVLVDMPGVNQLPPAKPEFPAVADLRTPTPAAIPAARERVAAVFYEKDIPAGSWTGLPSRRVSSKEIPSLDPADVGALIISGNAIPRKTVEGTDIPDALAGYLDRGGALVFYGATMHERGTMGEHGGVIDWYEHRPVLRYEPVAGWKFQFSPDGTNVPHDSEHGLMNGWHKAECAETGWKEIKVPGWWEDHLGSPRDGWGWYRAHFRLPEDARGKTVVLELGRIDDDDWTYVNGVFVGLEKGWQTFRRYYLKPADAVYSSLQFGGDNVVAIQVFDGGGGGGLHADPTRLGLETSKRAWTPINPKNGMTSDQPVRHGVVSWGPGGDMDVSRPRPRTAGTPFTQVGVGDFFNSWETSRGAFGFRVDGRGVAFTGPLSELAPLDVGVSEVFTDFAVSRPWMFEPLAYTETQKKILYPDRGEQYPCMARIVNTKTGGEIILIPASIAQTTAGPEILKKLRIKKNQ